MKESIKTFFEKYNKIIIFLLLLIISVGIYRFVFASDSDENKLTIKNVSISEVVDGLEPFDNNDERGNDSNDNNGIVRNFDTISYTVTYDLSAKEGEEVNTSDRRKIVVDVIFPNTIEGTIFAGSNGSYELEKVFDNYKYTEFELDSNIGESLKFSFDLSSVNSSNGTKFTPILVIKEKTDNDSKVISDLNDSQKSASYNSVSSSLSKFTNCSNTIGESNSCEVEVSGISNYFVNLYQGSTTKDDLVTNIPVGIMIGLKDRKTASNENKGVKGLLIPSSVSFDIVTDSSSTTNRISYVTNSERYYESKTVNPNNSLKYTVFIDDNNSIELPEVSTENYNGNGTINASNTSNGLIKLTISNIKNRLFSLSGTDISYFSTNSFEITSTRTNETIDSGEGDITIGVSAVSGNNTLSSISVVDSYTRFVGSYESEIEIYDSKDDAIDVRNKKTNGLAVVNYNEEFYINTSLQYGRQQGDGLDNLTNYIKIDNDAIDLVYNNEGMEYEISTSVDNSEYSAPSADGISLGYGKWNSTYFKISPSAPEGCPTDISSLSKENLMNLYGGPCIDETENLKWVDTLDDARLNDDDKEMGPIIVKTIFNPSDNGEYVYPGSSADIRLKVKVKDNYRLVNNAYQIVTSASGFFTDSNGEQHLYYLSNQNNHSGVDMMQNVNNYVKTNYDFAGAKANSINTNLCGSVKCAVSGNTILVSGVRVSKPEVSTYYESYDTTNFYYYPIEWRINASAYKNDSDAIFEKAYIYVYIPSYLQYVSKGNTGDFREYTNKETTTVDGAEYIKLTYEFNSSEITTGAIPTLRVFTNIYLDTKDNSKPKVYVTSDFMVAKRVTKADSTYDLYQYRGINSNSERTTIMDNVTVHNNSNVTTQGTVTPAYIERNGSYTYKMQAYNNTDEINYKNAKLYYILPYEGDSSYSEMASNFKATDFKVKLSSLPSGYTAYYTKGESSNIINNELNDSQNRGYSWIEWTNPTTDISDITAIKIEKIADFNKNTYFGEQDGISVVVTPVNAGVGDTYYNTFYLVTDRPSGYRCADVGDPDYDESCDDTLRYDKLYYTSTRDLASVYNRVVSGFVWEDYDYSGLYEKEESRLENIPVSVYRISDSLTNYDSNNPSTYVGKEGEEWVADTTTDINGRYLVRGLTEGKYYVKYTYDNEKYTPTDKNAGISTNISGAVDINSKALPLAGENVAISSVFEYVQNGQTEINNMNLGLKIRKQFVVDINKYITNLTVTSSSGTDSYNYNNATQVTLNVKNPRNTSVRVTYNFVVENTKYFPGYVGIIADRMPDGMTFNSNLKENQDWVLYGNTLYYTGLSGRLLIPNNKYYFSLVLDLDVTEGGNYVNVVAVRDLILMGEEISDYDFSSLDLFGETEEVEEPTTEENIEEGE